MKVLSLCGGIECGAVAIKRLGIKPEQYFSSEIDKDAIAVATDNHPDIIHIGDIFKVRYADGIIYSEQGNFYIGQIDLVFGGTPCKGFSCAGSRIDFDHEESKLFFEFHRILKEVKPTYFLFENVKMRREPMDIISAYLEVNPVEINSALVSAQNRKRLYWLGYMMERFFEENYCIECEHKRKEYEQKREQGLLGEAQREGAESILGEAQKRRVGLQNLRQKLSEDREKRNNKNLFEGVPILAEERKRQEQKQGESGCLQEKVLSREQDQVDRIPAPTQKNGCREGTNEESRFRFIKEMQKENADTFTKRDGWEYFNKNERLHLYNKHEANMCCVCCGKRLDYRPHNSVITWGGQTRLPTSKCYVESAIRKNTTRRWKSF